MGESRIAPAAVPERKMLVAAGTTNENRALRSARRTSDVVTSGIIAKVTGISSAASFASSAGRPGAVRATRGPASRKTAATRMAPAVRVEVTMIDKPPRGLLAFLGD